MGSTQAWSPASYWGLRPLGMQRWRGHRAVRQEGLEGAYQWFGAIKMESLGQWAQVLFLQSYHSLPASPASPHHPPLPTFKGCVCVCVCVCKSSFLISFLLFALRFSHPPCLLPPAENTLSPGQTLTPGDVFKRGKSPTE